jgi:hypothetical protein
MATIADKIPGIVYAGWTYAERDLRDRFDTPTKETHLMTRVGFTIVYRIIMMNHPNFILELGSGRLESGSKIEDLQPFFPFSNILIV